MATLRLPARCFNNLQQSPNFGRSYRGFRLAVEVAQHLLERQNFYRVATEIGPKGLVLLPNRCVAPQFCDCGDVGEMA